MEHSDSDWIVSWLDNLRRSGTPASRPGVLGFYSLPWVHAVLGLGGGTASVRHAERDLAAMPMRRRPSPVSRRACRRAASPRRRSAPCFTSHGRTAPSTNGASHCCSSVREGLPAEFRVGPGRFKEIVREQFLALLFDGERALKTLPDLLPQDRKLRPRRSTCCASCRRCRARRTRSAGKAAPHRGDLRRRAARAGTAERKAREAQEA